MFIEKDTSFVCCELTALQMNLNTVNTCTAIVYYTCTTGGSLVRYTSRGKSEKVHCL